MGYPRFRKFVGDNQYTWDFNILEPLAPIQSKVYRRYFDDLKQHPSGQVVGMSSVGTRVQDQPLSQLVFPLSLDLSIEQTDIMQQFFRDGAFWFFPDSDIETGYLVTYFPREFTPQPSENARFTISGGLVQLSKHTIIIDTGADGTEIEASAIQYDQQPNVRSGISLWINDRELIDDDEFIRNPNTHAIYMFPEDEGEQKGSDWTLLDNHFVRHETNFIDRYDRILFNWVRSIKLRYRLNFRAIGEDFIQKLIRFTAQRYGRFYPIVNPSLADDTLTDYIIPPNGYDLPFVNVRIVDDELDINYYNRFYDTTITLEEI